MSRSPITVLMTVRNGEPYLREAVQSVLSQTYRDFRFLILDNASTDNSRELIRSFGDPRIDLVELPQDIGQTAALNRGLAMITSPYIARIDADDIAYSRRLALQIAYLEAHPEVVLVAGNVDWFDIYGRIFQKERLPSSDIELAWTLIFTNPLAHSSIAMRRDAVLALGGYDESFRYAQDYELYCALMRKDFHLACLRGKVAAIRLWPESAGYNFKDAWMVEPVRTRMANLLHFLPDLPAQDLEGVLAVLSGDGQPCSDKTVSVAIPALVRIYAAVSQRQPWNQIALRRIQADLVRRVTSIGWSDRQATPQAARMIDSYIRHLASGPNSRSVYSGVAEGCLNLAQTAGGCGDKQRFEVELRRAMYFVIRGAAPLTSNRRRLAKSLVENAKICVRQRWWAGMLACGMFACAICPFLISKKCLSLLLRGMRRVARNFAISPLI